jgi:hypothetical protein
MHNLKVLLETLGYGFGALFVLAGLTGAPSAVALGLGLLALTLLASNAWGIRARFPHFNSPQALHRGAAYAGLIIATLLATAMLAPQTPEQRRAAAQPQTTATATSVHTTQVRPHQPQRSAPATATATATAVPTAVPTATAVPTRPVDAFPALKEVLSGDNNDSPSVPKLRSFRYYPDTGRANVDFNMDQNLTMGLTRDGLKMEMSQVYTALFHGSRVHVQSAAVTAWGPLQDQYGNVRYEPVYGTTLTRDVADQINWDADSATLQLQIIPGLWTVFLGNASLLAEN